MKKVISIFLVAVLMTVFALPVFAADSAVATTMRLEKAEGTVTLANANGRSLPVRADSKLYNGYTLATKGASYAYVSLDESKAVKVDEYSKASVRKSGKNLEIFLSAGKLFFNVKKPVANGETMKVRTATMVTGIRGTAGVIDVLDENTAVLYLLDGEVTMTDTNPTTGETNLVTVKGGQSVVSSSVPGQEGAQITRQEIAEKDVPGFVAIEIAKDPELHEKIEEQTSWDMKQIVEKAEETLKQDQEKNKNQQQAAENTQTVQNQEKKIDSLFPASSTPSSGGNKGTDDKEEEQPSEITLTNATAAQMNQALQSYSTVYLDNTSGEITLPINVAAGKTLSLKKGKMTLGKNASLTIYGTMEVASGAELINNAADNGGIQVFSPNSLKIAGNVINNGKVSLGHAGYVVIQPDGSFSNDKAGILENQGGKLENQGTLQTKGAVKNMAEFINTGTLEIESGSSFLNEQNGVLENREGEIENHGTLLTKGVVSNMAQLENSGTLEVQAGGCLKNQTGDSASGYLENKGKLTIASNATLENNAIIESETDITNSGKVTLGKDSILQPGIAMFTGTGSVKKSDGGNPVVKRIQKDGEPVEFLSFQSLLESTGSEETVYALMENLTLSENFSFPQDVHITLDLAGYTLKAKGSDLQNKGALTIQDSGTKGTLNLSSYLKNSGMLTIESGTITGSAGTLKNNGKADQLHMNGGIVQSTKNGSGAGYAIYGSFTYNGGTVRAKNSARVYYDGSPNWYAVAVADSWYRLEVHE